MFSSLTYWRLAFLWTVGIVVGCSIPATSLSPIEPALSADKLVHVGLFVGFGLLWMRGLCPPSNTPPALLRRRGLLLLGTGTLFAAGTEVYQHLLPVQRTGDPYDALADVGGLLVAVAAYVLVAHQGSASPPPDGAGGAM